MSEEKINRPRRQRPPRQGTAPRGAVLIPAPFPLTRRRFHSSPHPRPHLWPLEGPAPQPHPSFSRVPPPRATKALCVPTCTRSASPQIRFPGTYWGVLLLSPSWCRSVRPGFLGPQGTPPGVVDPQGTPPRRRGAAAHVRRRGAAGHAPWRRGAAAHAPWRRDAAGHAPGIFHASPQPLLLLAADRVPGLCRPYQQRRPVRKGGTGVCRDPSVGDAVASGGPGVAPGNRILTVPNPQRWNPWRRPQ